MGRLLRASPPNMRQWGKWLTVTNTLTYNGTEFITVVKKNFKVMTSSWYFHLNEFGEEALKANLKCRWIELIFERKKLFIFSKLFSEHILLKIHQSLEIILFCKIKRKEARRVCRVYSVINNIKLVTKAFITGIKWLPDSKILNLN